MIFGAIRQPQTSKVYNLDKYIQAANIISLKFATLNAYSKYPAMIASQVPYDLLRSLWATPDLAFNQRYQYLAEGRYRQALELLSILQADPSRIDEYEYDPETEKELPGWLLKFYSGVVINRVIKAFPLMNPETIISIGTNTQNIVDFAILQYPEIPTAFVCDVILAMLGYFGMAPGAQVPGLPIPDVMPPALPVITKTEPPEEKEESELGKMAKTVLMMVVAIAIVKFIFEGER